MPFVVEDGTGLDNATSYVDVSFGDTYLASQSAWTESSPAQKEEALNAGSFYADLRWGPLIKGVPANVEQALEFPRRSAVDRYGRPITGIPTAVKKAVCEYAIAYLGGSLYPQTPTTAKEVKRKSVTVGPITTSTEYMGAEKESGYIPFPVADNLMRTFTAAATGGNGGVMRA